MLRKDLQRSPNDTDVYAGIQLRLRRKKLGVSQKTLAESLGITFQQIQKYEKGVNRIGASRLYEICKVLKVHPSYFFQDIGNEILSNKTYYLIRDSNDHNLDDILEVVTHYKNIQDKTKKKVIIDVIKSLADKNSK